MGKIIEEKGYVTYQDVSSRLNNCYCVYKGEVHIIQASVKQEPGGNNHKVYITSLKNYRNVPYRGVNDKAKIVDYRDEEVDISALPLGFVNYEGDAVLIERAPMRRNQAGTCPANIICWPTNDNSCAYTEAMNTLVDNKYPEWNKAILSLREDEAESVAVSHTVALFKGESGVINVYLRKRSVGFIMDDRVFLYELPDRSFVMRTLEKQGIPL